MLPIDFCNIFAKLSGSRVYMRRSKHDFYLNSARLEVCILCLNTCFITFASVQILSSLRNNLNLLPHGHY